MTNKDSINKYSVISTIKMTVGLAILGLVNAITIDNQLIMMPNECYERVAIGERIPDENILKTIDVKTVKECQLECSNEKEKCMALSFGIGSQGNTTCILSSKSIPSEVSNLRPEDSVRDPDYDLFSKKMNCRPQIDDHRDTSQHDGDRHYDKHPPFRPGDRPSYPPSSGDHPAPPPPYRPSYPPSSGDHPAPPPPYRPSYPPSSGDHPATPPPYRPSYHPSGGGDYRPRPHYPPQPPGYGPKPTYYPPPRYPPSSSSNHYRPGEHVVTSIITEIVDRRACFRRVLAGKRVAGAYVKRSVACERLEDCQRECNDEHRFVCEGFNYRLDPTGRGQGVCELIELPLSRIDIGRDVYPDRDYDYYERDRNSLSPDCKPVSPSYGGSSSRYPSSKPSRPHYGSSGGGGGGSWDTRRPGGSYTDKYWPSVRPSYEIDRHQSSYDYGYYQKPSRPPSYLPHYKPSSYEPYLPSRDYYYSHPDFSYGHTDRNFYADRPPHRYKPPPPRYPPPSYEDHSYRPHSYDKKYYYERERDRIYWGLDHHRGPQSHWASYGGSYGNFGKPDSYYYGSRPTAKPVWYPNYDDYRKHTTFVPYKIGQPHQYRPPPPYWGQYGGSYGHNQVDHHVYSYWGLDRNNYSNYGPSSYDPPRHGYLPSRRYQPPRDGGYVGVVHLDKNYIDHHSWKRPYDGPTYGVGLRPTYGPGPTYGIGFKPTYGPYGDDIKPHKYDCSFRSGTGLRMVKYIVRKFFYVPNIYECEKLCFLEKNFPCYAYSFRYTVSSEPPTENCYLSDQPLTHDNMYKDTEPDKNFDIYTINQRGKNCMKPDFDYGRQSDCFWRTRSGQRLDQSVVRDSLNVKSVGHCELACIKANHFVCRSFSFRYGSPTIGDPIDNCQLTDWPFRELDPRIHLVPDPGYELYERGSYGHGCETNHFMIQGPWDDFHKLNVIPTESDKRCYIGYGRPARLLPKAICQSLLVETEEECQAACSKKREQGPSTCMSFSFRTSGDRRGPNCDLSDINQRDLRLNLDYVHDPDYWLFAWDIFNPSCQPTHPIGLPKPLGPSIPSGPSGGGGSIRPLPPSGPSRPGIIIPLSPPKPISRPPDPIPLPPSGPPSGGGGGSGVGGVGLTYLPSAPSGTDKIDFGYGIDVGDTTWQHYTVKGLPCRHGSKCEANLILGYWSCEIEGGEVGAWDYCCTPHHRCGYSEGYDYPWCYVGPSRDQWRKCSDRYYPYGGSSTHRPATNYIPQTYKPRPHPNVWRPKPIKPALIAYEVPDRPWVPHPGLTLDRLDIHHHKPHADEDEFLDPPIPGGLLGEPRYWPVAYLHKEPPPVANNSRHDESRQTRKDQSRMVPVSENKTKTNDTDVTPSDDSNKTDEAAKKARRNNKFLVYEVIDNVDSKDDQHDSKPAKKDEILSFETVENVDTDDIFGDSSSNIELLQQKDNKLRENRGRKSPIRRSEISFTSNHRDKLFETGTGKLPTNFRDRLAHERSSLTVAL